MSESCDIAIVGGGAAGLAAAIFASERATRGKRVTVLDGAKRLGAKILVSGGGRCNVTNDAVASADFSGGGPRTVIRNILNQYTQPQTVEWFASLGVQLKREPTGKLFPVTDSAQTVLDALLKRCEQLGIAILTDHRVTDITRSAVQQNPGMAMPGFPDAWLITHTHGTLRAARLILATGGRSLPKTGSDGGAFALLQQLGHTVTPTYPALVPLVLDDSFFHADLSGLSVDVQLTTTVDGKRIDQRAGALLFTHFGISGPVVMDASRHWVIAHAQDKPVELRCSFFPSETFEQVERRLLDAAARRANHSITRLLADDLPQRLARAIVGYAQLDPAISLNQLSKDNRRKLVHVLTDLSPPVVRDRGWNYAEVTAGGVPLAEIDFRTMASRKTPDLYLVGELLDIDGRIGGFNFQWAWSTGYTAGIAAAKSFTTPPTASPP